MYREEYAYELPSEKIALYPVEPRDSCNLIIIHKDSGEIAHRKFSDICDYLEPGDCIVLNDSKVQPVRLILRRNTGGIVEILLTHRLSEGVWTSLARPSKRIKIGEKLQDEVGQSIAEVIEKKEGHLILKFLVSESTIFDKLGLAPLPAYIGRRPEKKDLETYQTVYARNGFSIAAPTAGLHFTVDLLKKIRDKGVGIAYIQLDVGEGTFRPIATDNVEEHVMLSEYFRITRYNAELINKARRVIAVGTTVTRTLESFSQRNVIAQTGETGLFIYPGYKFKNVDALLTNFHQPGSTPLLLTAAFCGKDLLFHAYSEALKRDYRFLSYGDGMLIIPQKKTSVSFEDPVQFSRNISS